MEIPRVVFFGSTSDSVMALEKIAASRLVTLVAVVTQPPKPVGRKYIPTPTPVETWAKTHDIPVLSFPTQDQKPWLYADEQTVINALQPLKADLVVSACYGQKIPGATVTGATYGGINIHPSILPRWRGADPVPWAILSGDHQTGVTIVRLSTKFDQGLILAQKKLNSTDKDTSDPLRTKLFTMGADVLIKTLPDILSGKIKGTPQQTEDAPYARRLSRDDGFEPWDNIEKAFTHTQEATRIDRKFRALTPWPGVWTNVTINSENKRLKILALTLKEGNLLLQSVQLEGKTPVAFIQFQSAYLPKTII